MIQSRSDKVFAIMNAIVLTAVGLICLFPFFYIISVSLTPFSVLMKHGGFLIFPREVTLEAYVMVFKETDLPGAFLNTVFITLVGTTLSVALSVLMGFGLAKRGVPGRNFYIFLIVFTILFHGGIIPTFLVMKTLGLLNSLWALIFIHLIVGLNLLIVKTFFENLPEELEEAAVMDGCSDPGILLRITLPMSLPVVATVGLFYAVQLWNMYFPGILYISNPKLYPLQVQLQQLFASPDEMDTTRQLIPPETLKMASVVISTIPIVIVYPFMQKYFVKGSMLGAVKG